MQPIAAPLLQWFNANKRLLPFRQEPSAYHIWVSEIMPVSYTHLTLPTKLEV